MFDHIWLEDILSWIITPQDRTISPEALKNSELYFVWGYLMNPRFIEKLLDHAIPFAPAVIQGYRREEYFEDGKRGFKLFHSEKDVVMGIVLIDPSEEDVMKLDRFELVPNVIVKNRIEVKIGDIKREANIYRAAKID